MGEARRLLQALQICWPELAPIIDRQQLSLWILHLDLDIWTSGHLDLDIRTWTWTWTYTIDWTWILESSG